MLNTRLIFIDGIAGSGKSTLGHFISLQMQRSGINARWFYEEEAEGSHPIHLYSAKTAEEFMQKSLEKWRKLAEDIRTTQQVTVLESSLFQCSVGQLFDNDEISRDEIKNYVCEVLDIIKELNPALIYLYQKDIPNALQTIAKRRGQAWLEWYAKWTVDKPYARNRGMKGYQGAVEFWSAYRNLTDELFKDYPMPKLAIENSAGKWTEYRKEILGFLALPYVEDPKLPEDYMKGILGTYIDTQGSWGPRHGAPEIAIKLENEELYIYGLWWFRSRLIPKDRNVFYVEGLCIELLFREDEAGIAMTVEGKKIGNILGRTFVRK